MNLESTRLLALITARGGSKGLPGKNILPFAGIPLIAHSIKFAALCSDIQRCIVSTDSPEIAEIAMRHGADVPFMRPVDLAQDDTPIESVVRHALSTMESSDHVKYDYVLLLEPTSPIRLPEDFANAYRRLRADPAADGIISVSKPEFNPISVCVVERDGWMTNLIEEGADYSRRQDAPPVYRINGSLYIWRADFVRERDLGWQRHGKHLMHETPESRSVSIDTIYEFERAERQITGGIIALPWLSDSQPTV